MSEKDLPMPAGQLVRVLHALTEGLVFYRLLTPELVPDELNRAAFLALVNNRQYIGLAARQRPGVYLETEGGVSRRIKTGKRAERERFKLSQTRDLLSVVVALSGIGGLMLCQTAREVL